MGLFLPAFIAFALCSALILMLWPLCLSTGHVDHPGGRKKHDFSTPLSGGIAISVSILVGGLFWVPSLEFAGFTVGVGTLLLLGALDDRRHVSALVRLALQTLAVVVGMCLLGDVQIEQLGNLGGWGRIALDQWSVAFTIFGAVGVINAVNMIDGMDGLAGGFAAVLMAVLLGVGALTQSGATVLLWLSLGSVLGFLVFNLRMPWQKRARVFLGDAGSLVLGFILVWFAVDASQPPDAIIHPIAVVWLFGLPLCDTVYLMTSRLLKRQSPFTADRFHYHHLLQRRGLTPGYALYAWLFTAACFMAVGVLGSLFGVADYWLFYGFLLAFGLYSMSVTTLWKKVPVRRLKQKVKARASS
ncbi:MraY family glycosyltransferase [Salinisphaera japonica]|uniref:UDP-phosphate alpha-N-acetylglucosaminyl 1-phosphate transferase n=1 Tax=Salinisphaera japonica YTM-1 TaxID=1209778 RepID=A0A423PI08_9GAMM|nr:MraY family glycosyltransferase [Salinisphaera japonica]ROO25220.1 UDP-phosphate alpha-N-acetylglucosaminyl 1-phosphate transferase [Salinisphaera japonica YTM-1]